MTINVEVIPAKDSDQPFNRQYGYVLRWITDPRPAWIVGAGRCFSWFKFKRDAEQRAKVYNEEKP